MKLTASSIPGLMGISTVLTVFGVKPVICLPLVMVHGNIAVGSYILLRRCSVMFDYSCCDFCPYDTEYVTSSGTVCESCQAIKAERQRCRQIAGIPEEVKA